jgi:hypothetical protein
MKSLVSWAGILFVTLTARTSVQQPQHTDSCRFTVSASAAKPTITGPEEVTALVHVVEQPDSPVEIVAADFKDSFVAVANERFTEQLRCTLKIRNRSDQWIRRVNIMVNMASASLEGAASGSEFLGPGRAQGLAPGQEVEIQGCGSGGSGSAAGNHVRLVVFVGRVDLDDCFYLPSKRYPRQLGVATAG